MAYRAVIDPRIAGLKQLIATEPELLEHRGRIRREHDVLQDQADQLGIQVAEIERTADGGVIATVSGWLGRSSSPDDRARLQRELDEVTAKLAELVAAERDLQARLDALAAARQELSVLSAAGADALRNSEGPLGDELRALHAGLQADDEKLAALDAVIVARDRAETVVTGILEAQSAASEESSLVKGVVTVASIASLETPPVFEVDAARARAHLPESRERISELVALLEALRSRFDLLTGDRSLDLVCRQLASLARTSDAASASACLERLLIALDSERTTIVAHRDELAAQQRQILERSL